MKHPRWIFFFTLLLVASGLWLNGQAKAKPSTDPNSPTAQTETKEPSQPANNEVSTLTLSKDQLAMIPPSLVNTNPLSLGPSLTNETEPNGTRPTANAIAGTSAVILGSVYPNADEDFFSFTAQAGDRVYAATMTNFTASTTGDSVIEIQDSAGTVLEADDEDGSLNGNASSIAGRAIATSGTYYIRVRHFGTTSQIRPYSLYFRLQSGTPTPEIEVNDTPGAANPLPPSGWVSGARNPAAASEQDWFSFSANAGDTIYLGLDLDPERDNVQWNGRLGLGLFGDAGNQVLVVDDGSTGSATNPLSEALFMTVKSAGTYYAFVDSATATTGGPTATYNLSVTVFPAANQGVNCTTYASTDVPKTIGPGTGLVSSTITVPGNPRIADMDVEIQLNHALMADIDAHLRSPQGNDNGLFTDIGATVTGGQTQMDTVFDDEAGIAPAFTVLKGTQIKPELAYRLSWFDGENAGGTWTLDLRDDGANTSGGTLTAWSIRICEAPPPPTCPGGTVPTVIYSTDFEANDGGFTHSGTQDEWERGLPATIATSTTNPVAGFNTCNSGTNCWKTDLDNTYNASSSQDLKSPSIALNGAGVVGPITLSWAQRYQIETTNFDHSYVDVQLAGGGSARRLWEWQDASMVDAPGNPTVNIGASAGWGVYSKDISSYLGQNIEFLAHLDSDSSVNFAGLAIDDVSVTACAPPPAISINLDKTVGTNPNVCAITDSVTLPFFGGPVTYCYKVTNTGNTSLNSHTLVDDHLGTLLNNFPFTLGPGASTFITQTATIAQTTTNSATWTATNGTNTANDTDTAVVNVPVPAPAVNLIKTVGTNPNVCAPTDSVTLPYGGGNVTYCYTIQNTGNITLTGHTLTDDHLGTILNNMAYTLAPGASTFVTVTTNVANTTTNTGVWTAVLTGAPVSVSASDSDTALVTVQPPAPILGVSATSFTSVQPTNVQMTQTLTLSNIGTGNLVWNIAEVAPTLTLSPEPANMAGFSEGFDNVLGLPSAGWAVVNHSQPLGTTTWYQGLVPNFPAQSGATNSYAAVDFNSGSGLSTLSNWLITPEIPLANGAVLTFYTRTRTTVNFPDRLQVRMSTNGSSTNVGTTATDVGDFTTLLVDINPNLTLTGYPTSWTQFTVTLSGVGAPTTGRLAFRYFVTNGGPSGANSDYIGIDTVTYSVDTTCFTPNPISWVSESPTSGTTAGGSSNDVTLTFDSTGLAPATYNGILCVNSNEGGGASKQIPVTLQVSPSPDVLIGPDVSGAGYLGSVVTYTLDLTNTGDAPDTYNLAVTGETWTTTLSASSATLAAGQSTSLSAWVQIPAGANNGDTDVATVWATSQLDGMVNDTAVLTTTGYISPVFGVELSNDMAMVGDVGTTVTYTLWLTNSGNVTESVNLSASGQTWPTTLSDNSVTLGGGETAQVWATVDVPANAGDGDTDAVTITAAVGSRHFASAILPPVDTAVLTTTANIPPSYGVTIGPDSASSGLVGTTVTYTLWITNEGNVADTFALSASGNSWTTNLSATSLTLNVGESDSVEVTVAIPGNAANGDTDTATVTALSSNGVATDTADVTTTAVVNATYGVTTSEDMADSGLVGTTVTYTVHLTNTGNVVNSFALSVSSNWAATLSTSNITLNAGETGSVSVWVQVPANAADGDSDVATFTASGAGGATDSTDLTTTAVTNPTYGVVTSGDMAQNGLVGTTVQYTVYLTNTGDVANTFDLAVTNTWTTTLSVNTITLNAGQSGNVSVWVEVPIGAADGDSDVATLTASGAGGATDSTDLTTTALTEPIYTVQTSADMAQNGLVGTTVTYTVQVTNTGNVANNFDLLVTSVWTTSLSANSLNLTAGQVGTVSVWVEVPASAVNGNTDVAEVTASGSGGAVDSTNLQTTAVLTAVYGVDTSADMALSGTPGSTVTYTVQVTNTGNLAGNFDIGTIGNQWPVTASTNLLALNAGETDTVWVWVHIPLTATNGVSDGVDLVATAPGGNGPVPATDMTHLTTTAVAMPVGYTIYLPVAIRP